MALNRHTIPEMTGVSGPWVEPRHPERVLLASVPATAALLPHAEAAHAGLIQALYNPEQERQEAIRFEQGGLDVRHDHLARGISGSLTAERHFNADTPLEEKLEQLEQLLFPDGLKVVGVSYREAAGRAEVRSKLLTVEQEELLASIPVREATLLDRVREWNQLAARIGALENERLTPAEDSGQRLVRQARHHWIRVVKTMLEVIAFEVEATPALQRILDRVENIDIEIERRFRGGGELPGEDDGAEDELPGEDDGAEDELPGDSPDEVETAPGEGGEDVSDAPGGEDGALLAITTAHPDRPADTAEIQLS